MQQNNQQAVQYIKLLVGEKSYFMKENATENDKALFEIVIGLLLLQKRQALRNKPDNTKLQNYFFSFDFNNKFGYSYLQEAWFINDKQNPTFSDIADFTQQFDLNNYRQELLDYKNNLLNNF